MSRRHAAEKREILPDPKFKDVALAKFINRVMVDGKKSVAETIVYGALDILEEKIKGERNLDVFHNAWKAVAPRVEVKSRRVGGATFQVPVEVRYDRGRALAFTWIIEAARKRGERTMRERLAGEIMDIQNNRGSSLKKRDDTHKMADANKAFAHFRWGGR